MGAPTELPILYSTLMVEAKLAGTKTMTRRTAGLHRINQNPDSWTLIPARIKGEKDGRSYAQFSNYDADESILVKCPYGEVDGLLYGREMWNTLAEFDGKPEYDVMGIEDFVYSGGSVRIDKWRPSIHMPKAAARIWDRIVSIKLERIQDITEENAIKEGYPYVGVPSDIAPDPASWFQDLWYLINGEESWRENPWVWVIETRPLSITGRPLSYIENVENPKPALGRQVAEQYKFFTLGTFESMYAAQKWIGDNDYSYGSTDIGGFVGIMKGKGGYIAKWKNLSAEERNTVDGIMYSQDYREGVVEVIIFKTT